MIFHRLYLDVSTTSRIGCGRTYSLIRRRRSSCGARPVGASTDFQPLHSVGSMTVAPVSSVRDLGILVDSDLVMRTHVCRAVSSCFAALRQLRSIRHLVSATVFQSLVAAFSVGSTTVMGQWHIGQPPGLPCPPTPVVQNAAARLVFRLRRSDHITDALVSLHWLRVPERIIF